MRPNPIIIFSIVLLVWLPPLAARTYRWVDENGITIYSQSPPPSGQATIIKPPPPAPSPPEESNKSFKERLDSLDKEKEKEGEAKKKEDIKAKNAEIMKHNCENARKNLESLEQHSRIRMKMDDGNYKQLTYEEREAEIEKAEQAIKKNCK